MTEVLHLAFFVLALSADQWIGIATLALGTIAAPIILKLIRTPADKQQYVITDTQNAQEILRGTNEALTEEWKRERELRQEWQKYAARLEDCLTAHRIDFPVEDRP